MPFKSSPAELDAGIVNDDVCRPGLCHEPADCFGARRRDRLPGLMCPDYPGITVVSRGRVRVSIALRPSRERLGLWIEGPSFAASSSNACLSARFEKMPGSAMAPMRASTVSISWPSRSISRVQRADIKCAIVGHASSACSILTGRSHWISTTQPVSLQTECSVPCLLMMRLPGP